ncbi:MAG: hypothetical protein ACI9G1_004945 [Pirellulaceae bacterium]|jgi:hypothetical protein
MLPEPAAQLMLDLLRPVRSESVRPRLAGQRILALVPLQVLVPLEWALALALKVAVAEEQLELLALPLVEQMQMRRAAPQWTREAPVASARPVREPMVVELESLVELSRLAVEEAVRHREGVAAMEVSQAPELPVRESRALGSRAQWVVAMSEATAQQVRSTVYSKARPF